VKAIKEGLFDWQSDQPGVLVSKCTDCGTLVFPIQTNCPDCCTNTAVKTKIGNRAKLHAFTGVRNPVPDGKAPIPYTVGIVDFPEGIRMMGVLTEENVNSLQVGMDVEVVMEKSFEEDGENVITYKFKPIF
jgi:uncharacterized protein